MTEQNSLPPDDHELEQFLARRSELSRLHRASTEGEGAPSELDAPVLAQAQAELRRPLVRSRRLPRWSGALALAASLVLVVSLAWMAQQQPLRQAVAPAAAPLPASPAANEGVVTESMAAQANAPLAAKAETPEQLKKISPALAMAVPKSEQPARKPSPPPQAERLAKAEALQAPSAIAMEQAVSAADTAPAAPSPAPMASNAGAAAAPFASVPPPPAMAAPTVAAAASRAVSANPCTSPQDAAALRQAQAGGDTDSAAWLERIRRLRDAPDPVAARAELACFSYIHSPQQVPDDLKPLLQAAP
jgi:outer membrane biosynthesis protein TonB